MLCTTLQNNEGTTSEQEVEETWCENNAQGETTVRRAYYKMGGGGIKPTMPSQRREK